MTEHLEAQKRLVSRCVSGDRQAAETFVRRLSPVVYNTVRRTFKVKNIPFSEEDVQDLHNTVFLEFFEKGCRKLRQYTGKNGCSIASWVRVVTVRRVLNHLRQKGVDSPQWEVRRVALEELVHLASPEASPSRAVEEAEERRRVTEAIEGLPPRERLFMRLHFEKGLELDHVARAMGCSVQHLYVVKHRAVRRLREILASSEMATGP